MDVREKLVEIVKKAAYSSLPSNTKDFHLNMFVTNLLSHGVTVQEWISVDDRLPEAGGYVVCIAKRNPFSRFMPMVARIGKNGWVNPITEQYISEVTHWMPLPEPPMSAIMDGDAERRNT